MKNIQEYLSQSEKIFGETAARKIASINKSSDKAAQTKNAAVVLEKMQNESQVQNSKESLSAASSVVEVLKNASLAHEKMENISNPLSKAISLAKESKPKAIKESNASLSAWHKAQELRVLENEIEKLKQEKEVIEQASVLKLVVEDYVTDRLANAGLPVSILREGENENYDDLNDDDYIFDENSEHEESIEDASLYLGDSLGGVFLNFLGFIAESIRQSDIVYINKQIRSLERCSAKARSAIHFTDEGRDVRKQIRRYSPRIRPSNTDKEDFQIIPTYNTIFKRNLIWKSNGKNRTIKYYHFAA